MSLSAFALTKRRLEDEILDSLPNDDPSAIRSRADLRLINFLMGNQRWIQSCVRKNKNISHLSELGAGDGGLLTKLSHEDLSLTGLDLQPKPENLSLDISWNQLDVSKADESSFSDTSVAVLFLHHLNDDQLLQLGEKMRTGRYIYAVEPHRSMLALIEAYALFPVVNHVTKHDMIVSIKAGFRMGELPKLLGLHQDRKWAYFEHVTPLGAYRLSAHRI